MRCSYLRFVPVISCFAAKNVGSDAPVIWNPWVKQQGMERINAALSIAIVEHLNGGIDFVSPYYWNRC